MKTIRKVGRVSNPTVRMANDDVKVLRIQTAAILTTPNSVERRVVRTIESTIQRYVFGCAVQFQDEAVVVSGQTQTYYHRQLAEHQIREIAGKYLNKGLVSKIHVAGDLG